MVAHEGAAGGIPIAGSSAGRAPIVKSTGQEAPYQGCQTTCKPLLRLKVEDVQYAPALRYHTW